ncbi:hypothetical protein B0H17DRAFT_1141315 [Mycena rosella]|uniref:Uncharacterized protein n=1 Tax=Mycena rosella TaxID=1033263 RepID=A0AAD7D0G5_MYCRO|nr:hypothetical protein B0H17DRAFT_1141315 [Mycena rosella]
MEAVGENGLRHGAGRWWHTAIAGNTKSLRVSGYRARAGAGTRIGCTIECTESGRTEPKAKVAICSWKIFTQGGSAGNRGGRPGRAGGRGAINVRSERSFLEGQPVMGSKGMPNRRLVMLRMVNRCKCRRALPNDDKCAVHSARRRHNYGAALHRQASATQTPKIWAGACRAPADGSTATHLDDTAAVQITAWRTTQMRKGFPHLGWPVQPSVVTQHDKMSAEMRGILYGKYTVQKVFSSLVPGISDNFTFPSKDWSNSRNYNFKVETTSIAAINLEATLARSNLDRRQLRNLQPQEVATGGQLTSKQRTTF